MRKLFIQFYLLLIACFLTVTVLSGIVYKQAGDAIGERYLTDLLSTTLSMIKLELKNTPPNQWAAKLDGINHDLSFPVYIEPVSNFQLDKASMDSLARGDIVMLEQQYLFLQSMPDQRYVLVAGPLRYLFFLHQLHWIDYTMLAIAGLSLAIPVFLWMRPHWRDLKMLEHTASQLEQGNLQSRVHLPERSGVKRLGTAFNRMADGINVLLNSKKSLTDAVAHELRTPLARLRYRLALLDDNEAARAAMERDLDAVDSLIAELLLHARLERPAPQLNAQQIDLAALVKQRIEDAATMAPQIDWQLDSAETLPALADAHLLARLLDNLLNNARRHTKDTVKVQLQQDEIEWRISIEDNGTGIAETDRQRIFEPFVRLDESRHRDTGGHGLGLAIVSGIAHAHHGSVEIDQSPTLGGARFTIRWPKA